MLRPEVGHDHSLRVAYLRRVAYLEVERSGTLRLSPDDSDHPSNEKQQ